MAPISLVLLFVMAAAAVVTAAGTSRLRSDRSLNCYGDARDHYFDQPLKFGPNLMDDDEDYPADKCRLAKRMETEIQYLRTLMDKCDRCQAGTTQINDGRRCEDRPCFKEASCIDTRAGSVCGPCPVGYDGNGINCVRRFGC